MKKLLILLLFGTVLFAASDTSTIKNALNNLEETSKSVLLVTSLVEGVISVVFLGLAGFIYLKKLKGKEKKEMLWIAAAAILGLIGAMFLLGTVLGIVAYLTIPTMTQTVFGGSGY